jgi:hypothetical protein
MTKLEKIVKAAKALRKKYPNKYSKWTDYIKAASKQVAGFEGVSRKGDKTTVHYSKKSPATKKKAAPKKATQSTLFGVKKAAPKKKAPARSSHKDTKSHNVNIRVVSGINLNEIGSELFSLEMKIKKYQIALREAKKVSEKKEIRYQISVLNKQFKALKLYLNSRAKFI